MAAKLKAGVIGLGMGGGHLSGAGRNFMERSIPKALT